MRTSSERKRRIIVYGLVYGHSLWSANQLPVQGVNPVVLNLFEVREHFRLYEKFAEHQN